MEVLEVSKVSDVIHIENLHSEKAKLIALEISNDVARGILRELYKNPTSISKLSEKLNLPMSTVQYHINRLMELGVIRIAQKKLGKRLKEVKMYAYDKEGIVFLSTQKEEFESFLDRLITRTIKELSLKVAVVVLIAGLVISLFGEPIIRNLTESSTGFYGEITGYDGEINTLVIILLYVTFFLGALTSFITLYLLLKLKKDI